MSNAPINIMVLRIKETLEAANQPMTTGKLAKELMVTTQTVRNHLPRAIQLGYARETPFKDGKASTYESTNKKTNFLPSVATPNGDVVLLRDFFIKWSSGTITDPLTAMCADILFNLYASVVKFVDSDDRMAYAEQIHTLKAIKQKANKRREHIAAALAILNGVLSNDNLWTPKDLIKYLLILDEDMDDTKIKSYLDRAGKGDN